MLSFFFKQIKPIVFFVFSNKYDNTKLYIFILPVKKKQKENLSARFSPCTPKGLTEGETTLAGSEVGCSESI